MCAAGGSLEPVQFHHKPHMLAIELQDLVSFGLALVWSLLVKSSSFLFEMIMLALCHCYCKHATFDYFLIVWGLTVKRLLETQSRLNTYFRTPWRLLRTGRALEVVWKAFLYSERAISLQEQWMEGCGLKWICLGVKLTGLGRLMMMSVVN